MFENFNAQEWDNFVVANNGDFLQSSYWKKFQQNLGRDIFYLKNDQNQILLIKHKLPFQKSYLYSPRGPIVNQKLGIEGQKDGILMLIKKIKKIAKKENTIFWRFEPFNFKFQVPNAKKVLDNQPSMTTILNLEYSEKEILNSMHSKTRYNIRLAERHNVHIHESHNLKKFLELLRQTTTRDKFKAYNDIYYQKLFEINNNFVKLYVAQYKNLILAANIIVFFNKTAYYVHGASSNYYRNMMAPYLLHWEIIKEAKRKGFSYYDFWGISGKKWPGLTRFKRGFRGEEIIYPGTFDFIFNKRWYWLYKISKFIIK